MELNSVASYAGSIEFLRENPRLGYASPGADTLAACYAGLFLIYS